MLVLARRDERSREEAEAKALGAKTLGAKAPKAKALETEALEAKEDEREAEVGAAKMPRVQKKRRTQAEGTSYTVGSLAKLAGVTVRALHHYEDEGLLHPERTASGYRRYGAADVERLQQILLLRSCGLSLGAIRDAFADDRFDFRAVLTDHLATLRARQKELETLMGTVEKTIASLEGRCTMTDKERFEGMKARAIAENEEHYGAEVRRRHGDAAMDAANERMAGMTEAEWNDAKALEAAILEQLVQAKATGDPTGEAARELCAMHAGCKCTGARGPILQRPMPPWPRATWPIRVSRPTTTARQAKARRPSCATHLWLGAPSNNPLSDARFAWGSLVSLPQGTMASVPGSHVRPGPFS